MRPRVRLGPLFVVLSRRASDQRTGLIYVAPYLEARTAGALIPLEKGDGPHQGRKGSIPLASVGG